MARLCSPFILIIYATLAMTVFFIMKLKPCQPHLPTAFHHLIPNTFHSSPSLSFRWPLHHSLLLQGTQPHDHYVSAKKKDFRNWNKWEGEVLHLYIILRWSSIWRWSYQILELTIISHDLGVLNSHIVFAFESTMASEFSQQRNVKLKGRAKFSSVTFKMLSGDKPSKDKQLPHLLASSSLLFGSHLQVPLFLSTSTRESLHEMGQEHPGCNLKTSY